MAVKPKHVEANSEWNT